MSLTFTPTVWEYFSRNPIDIRIFTDNFETTEGVVAVSYIEFTAAPTLSGSHLTGSFNGIDFDMISQTTPITYDGNHFRVKTGLETLDEWLTAFAGNVDGNYDINEHYVLSVDEINNRVYFTAKEPGPEWAITFTATPGTSSATEVEPGVATVTTENFRVFLIVEILGGYINGDDSFEVEMEMLGNDLLGARIEENLRSFLQHQVPDSTLPVMIYMEYHTCFFRLKYYEAYGETITEQYVFSPDDIFSVLLGGLDEVYYQSNNFFPAYVAPYFKFLTWQKRTKKITTSQPEWLAFLHIAGSEYDSYEVKVEMIYADDTSEIQYVFATDFGPVIEADDIDRLMVIYFQTSYDFLVSPIAADDVVKYKVTVVDPEHNALSEVFTYLVIDEIPTRTKYFLFENSIGFYDTLRTTGERITGIDVTGEIMKKFFSDPYPTDGKYAMSGADGKMKFIQNTGWLEGRSSAEYLALFLISPVIFELVDGEKVPIITTRREIKLHADNDKLFALEFEYFYAFDFIGRINNIS